MYGFDDKTSEGKSFIKVTPKTAISTGRFIKDIRFVPAKDGANAYLEIEVRDANNATASRRYYEPKIDERIKDEEALEAAQRKINAVAKNLTTKFLGEDYKITGVKTFEEFCNKIITDIKKTPGWDKKELRIKVVLNANGYPTLPSYSPIFELATVPPEQSILAINPRFDVVEGAEPDEDTKPDISKEDLDNAAF